MNALRRNLDRMYWWLCDRVTPGLVNAQHRYLDALGGYLTPETRWLDLGCGKRITPDWMPDGDQRDADLANAVRITVGIDMDRDSLATNQAMAGRVRGDLHRLPFADRSFDLVTANMVVEHVTDPVTLLREVRRVLAPGGVFLFHTPNVLYPPMWLASHLPQWLKNGAASLLENRAEEDVFPTTYRLNTPACVRRATDAAAMEVDKLNLVDSSTVTAMLGPLAAFELSLVRLLRWRPLHGLRGNVIAVLRRPVEQSAALRRAA